MDFVAKPFGIASAPAIFHRLMDKILHGLQGVICYINDILTTGKDDVEHLQHLVAVINRLEKHRFRLNKDKCHFVIPSVEYLGHRIDQEGIRVVPSKMEVITNASPPTNIQEFQSFLDLLNYYRKFIRNLSSILHPLKRQLVSVNVLTLYNPRLPINLAADASAAE